MTTLELLKDRLDKVERKYGKDDFIAQQLRQQIASAESSEPSAALEFTIGARSLRSLQKAEARRETRHPAKSSCRARGGAFSRP